MDKYILGQSEIGYITKDSPEVILNLQLEKNTYYDNSLIYGYITDICGKPIENASISFLNKNNEEIGSVYTSKEGRYAYLGVKYNSIIKIMVKKIGYKSSVSRLLKTSQKKFKYNAYLKRLSAPNKTLISGHVTDKNNTPIEGSIIYLLKNCCNKKCVCQTTISNKYGQFVFPNVCKNKYLLFVNDPNFNTYNEYIEIIETHKIFNIDIILTKKESPTKITGQITDDTGKEIPNALVVLYVMEKDEKLIPVECTLCDEEGKYSFVNIPYNNYIVKAKNI